MSTIVPLDTYLLETFTSVKYLTDLRDTWGEMVAHLEECLDRYMANLPADYRRRPLPEQPDAVWGELVLPNFRNTFAGLCSGVVELSNGDYDGLYSAQGPKNDFMGQREYSDAWLQAADRKLYIRLLEKSCRMASNICATIGPYWEPGIFSDYQKRFGPIDMPIGLPTYRLKRAITVTTDGSVNLSGVYVPDKDNSIAAFIMTGKPAPKATVVVGMESLLDEKGDKYGERTVIEYQPCLWTLVERDVGATTGRLSPSLMPIETLRIPGGDICPAAGYYFTPAKTGSRQHFQQGQTMPPLDSAYGSTFWQLDSNQG